MSMDLGLRGKIVVITGGATGIGLSAALAFAAEGAKLAICGRREQKLRAAAQLLAARGYECVAAVADASDEPELQRFAMQVYEQYGRIDIWINNAGVATKSRLLDLRGDAFDEVMRVNLKSVFIGAKIAAYYMKQSGGVILNASSFASVIPTAGNGAYAAAKAGVTSLTRTLAAELAPDGIRVNAYIPGMIITDMSKPRIEEAGTELSAQIALNRLGQPDEVAPALLFLASDAARYITGTAVDISGGKFAVQNPHVPWTW
jgi:NAD(P)-dependent dehydrogenase (short-subunit alcohol dehydrogenase family)